MSIKNKLRFALIKKLLEKNPTQIHMVWNKIYQEMIHRKDDKELQDYKDILEELDKMISDFRIKGLIPDKEG